MNNKDIFALIFSATALLLSFLTFVFNQNHNNNVYKLSYENSINTNKPIVFLDSFQSHIEIDKNNLIEMPSFNDTVKVFSGNNYHIISLAMKNKGHDNAKIKAIFAIDTFGTTDVLRQDIISHKTKRDNLKSYFYSEFIELPNVASIRYEFAISLPLKDFDTITTHILVVYENDLGNLYDSYIWVTYSHGQLYGIAEPIHPPRSIAEREKFITCLDSFKHLTLVDKSYSFHTYSENEIKMFNTWYNE